MVVYRVFVGLVVAGISPALANEAAVTQVSEARRVQSRAPAAGLAVPLDIASAQLSPAALAASTTLNASQIVQSGVQNRATVMQSGGGNYSSIVQQGSGNVALVAQTGRR